MISYNILHYNRPYLLEPNIKILRKLLPGIQIIVSDDGSDLEIINRIKKMEIDDFVSVNHGEQSKYGGSCSNAIEAGVKLCKQPFYIFSEDDFWYVGKYNNNGIKGILQSNFIPPVIIDLNTDMVGIKNGVEILSTNRDIVWVSLAYNSFGKIVEMKRRNTNNWPYIMRTEDRQKILLDANLNIKGVENDMFLKLRSCFNDSSLRNINGCVYTHTGGPFCVNEARYSKRKSGFNRWRAIGLPFRKDVRIEYIKKILNKLIELYLQGKFFIDVDELFQSSTDQSFMSAINRVRNEVTVKELGIIYE